MHRVTILRYAVVLEFGRVDPISADNTDAPAPRNAVGLRRPLSWQRPVPKLLLHERSAYAARHDGHGLRCSSASDRYALAKHGLQLAAGLDQRLKALRPVVLALAHHSPIVTAPGIRSHAEPELSNLVPVAQFRRQRQASR